MMQRNFYVYKSSAGSGKTYTLVKEYLKLVLYDPASMRHILAITFTNAAAAEMKERIIGALANIASLQETPENKSGSTLLSVIISDLEDQKIPDAPSRETLIRNAQKVFNQVLHNYSDFSVCTIDSFVHRVIRTFAFDLRIPLNFEVELDDKALLTQAVDLLIDRVGHDEKLTELLVSYIIRQADDEQDVRIDKKIVALAKTLTEEDSNVYTERLRDVRITDFMEVADRLRKSVSIFEHRIQQEAEKAMAMIKQKDIPESAFSYGKSGIYNYFNKLAAGQIKKYAHPKQRVTVTITEDKWFSGKCTSECKEGISQIRDTLVHHFNNIQKAVNSEMESYTCQKALLKTIYPLAVLSEVEKMMEEIKTENVLLHISDFNKRIAAVVCKQPVPFIYERLGERYHHYMIDEFQDTSLLQWQNLLPLASNALSEGHLSLVVGDGKQAIYRFRNGDVEQFASLPHLTEGIRSVAKPDWETGLKNNYHEKNLDTNWRSDKAIVDFNNRFFDFAKNELTEKLQNIYADTFQEVPDSREEGYVHIHFAEAGSKQELNEQMVPAIIRIINECVAAGHPLSDITILCRGNSEAGLVARELLAAQIPVISKESLLLNQSDEVNLFVAIIKLLTNPHDAIAATEMVTLLHRGHHISTPDTLHQCLCESGLYQRNKNNRHLTVTTGIEKLLQNNGVDFSFQQFAHLNIYDSCETIVRLFFSRQKPPNPFPAFFMDAVYDFSEKQLTAFDDFLAWWEDNGSDYSIIVPEGVEAVQVMTIHKSKGLQFPVVIYPFAANNASKLTKKGLWTDGERTGIKELPAQWLEMNKVSLEGTPFEADLELEKQRTFLDMLNTTYVAFTRPSKKLFVLTKKESKSYTAKSVNGLLYSFLKNNGLWDDNMDTYTFGTFIRTEKKSVSEEAIDHPLEELLSNPWSQTLRMRSHQRERSMLFDSDDPLERGNLMHRAMEHIHHPADITPVLEQMKNNGEIDTGKMTEWDTMIRNMLKDPVIARCFVPGTNMKTEAGLYDDNGDFYRPDRVVMLENECVVIDYKTGRQYEKHRQQMNTYAGILHKMGYMNIKKVLMYLDQGKIMLC